MECAALLVVNILINNEEQPKRSFMSVKSYVYGKFANEFYKGRVLGHYWKYNPAKNYTAIIVGLSQPNGTYKEQLVAKLGDRNKNKVRIEVTIDGDQWLCQKFRKELVQKRLSERARYMLICKNAGLKNYHQIKKLAAVYDPNGVVFKNLVYALVNTNEKNKNKAPVGLFMQNIAKQIREWMNGESTYPYPISYKQYESIQSASFLRSN